MDKDSLLEKGISVAAYIVMVGFNILGNVLSLNGLTTQEISDKYPTLISPAGYTFSIWGLVYLLMLLFVIYQQGWIKNREEKLPSELISLIRIFFVISSLCNAAWIIAWHYEYMALSLMLSVVIFICLAFINRYLYEEELSLTEKLMLRIPFGIYFGWISVATVLNTSVLLVSIRWSRYGIPASIWSVVVIILVTSCAVAVLVKLNSIAFTLSVLWAFGGILVKHLLHSELQGKYPMIIYALLACSILLLSEAVYIRYRNKKYGV